MIATATTAPIRGGKFVLGNVPWSQYSRLLREFAEQRRIRLTYDQGELEIMSPSHEHDRVSRFLGSIVEHLALELGMPYGRGGSTTLRLRSKQRGIEADDCFWLESAPRLQLGRSLDLRVNPPPDLAIEVDVTNSSMDRLAIYADLGVPEIWRYEDDTLEFLLLQPDSRYESSANSRSFRFVRPDDLLPFLRRARQEGDQSPVMHDFITWIRSKK